MSYLDFIIMYVFERPNPLIQLFYLLLLSVGTFVFFIDGFQLLWHHAFHSSDSYPVLSLPPLVHILLIPTSLWMNLYYFYKASFSDPGIVTSNNVEAVVSYFKYDQKLFTQSNCRTCHFQKPARSKHCRLCEKCIAKYDHHCIWLNNCVGYLNHRYFLLFLLSLIWICLYGSILILSILRNEYQQNRIWDYKVRKDDQTVERADFMTQLLILVTHFNHIPFAALGMFLFVCIWIVFIFTCYHFYLLFLGQTTNEGFKMEELEMKESPFRKSFMEELKETFFPNELIFKGHSKKKKNQ